MNKSEVLPSTNVQSGLTTVHSHAMLQNYLTKNKENQNQSNKFNGCHKVPALNSSISQQKLNRDRNGGSGGLGTKQSSATVREFGREITNAQGISNPSGYSFALAQKPNKTVQNIKVSLRGQPDQSVNLGQSRAQTSQQALQSQNSLAAKVRSSRVSPRGVTKTSPRSPYSPRIKHAIAQLLTDRRKTLIKDLEVCDLLDLRNPQTLSEYAPQIFSNMRSQEDRFLIDRPNDFYCNPHIEIKEKTRAYMMEWIIEVGIKFKLLDETIFLTINYLDRYFDKSLNKPVGKKDLQTVAIAGLLIAAKYEEIYPPSCSQMIKVSGDQSVTKAKVLSAEKDILTTLQFDMQPHSSHRFLQRLIKLTNADHKVFSHAMYQLESLLLDCDMTRYRPSLLASGALFNSFKVIKGFSPWNAVLIKTTDYTEEEVQDMAKKILKSFDKLRSQDLDVSAKKKYSQEKWMKAAEIPLQQKYEK